jgi:formylglycine-generating enzyme required for sulfatase activity
LQQHPESSSAFFFPQASAMNALSAIDTGLHPLADGNRPIWASGWGEDEFGVYAEFSLGGAAQRLRWIPPGCFWMGSPEGEAGRYDEEEPRHQVTLTSGFWMMNTPVRQSLWLAVMEANPSCFVSSERPVESANYTMIEQFLSRLNDRVPGLDLELPSEAQWEYACRAGTETATYAGDLEILGECNAPLLHDIAWYGGNSGVGFELENGEDSSWWPEKQFLDSPSGTHPVAQKRANAFGLFDMLGNVWEWCEDHYHDSYNGAPADGSAWLTKKATALRILRGGSWRFDAKDVRAACRGLCHPEGRFNGVGIRCVRVQNPAKEGGQ